MHGKTRSRKNAIKREEGVGEARRLRDSLELLALFRHLFPGGQH